MYKARENKENINRRIDEKKQKRKLNIISVPLKWDELNN